MKKLLSILILVMLISISFAEVDCPLSFTENITVRALDAKLRPIEGAAIQIYYQLDHTTSKGYVTTPPYYTNSSGFAETINIHNIETNPLKLDCEFTVYAKYDGKQNKKTYSVAIHPDIIDIQLDSYILDLRVFDQFSQPIQGAEVLFNNISLVTGADGHARANVGTGKVRIFVKYAEGKIEEIITLKNDTSETIGLHMYDLTLKVADDAGNPLQATATIGNLTLSTNENGTIKSGRLASSTPDVTVKYKNVEKKVGVDLGVQTKYNVVFDLATPSVGNVKTISAGKVTKLVIPVSDPNFYASGIDTDGVTVKYKLSDSDSWRDAPVYLSGKDQYVSEIPTQPEEMIIHFFIEVKDRDGNRKSIEGQFLSPAAAGPPQKNETLQNNTSGGSAINPPATEGIPLLYIAAGFIILVIVIYALYRYKFSGEQ